MCRLLRHEHQEAAMRVGLDAHKEMRALFDMSAFRKAWLADGKLIGLGGVVGTVISPGGFIWLALSEQAKKYPIALVKEARRQLDEIMVTKVELATTIIGGDDAAKRLAVFLGFHVADIGPGMTARSRFGRRDLSRYLDSDPELRIPLGGSYAIRMAYHAERVN
jgi:hypothetical protein